MTNSRGVICLKTNFFARAYDMTNPLQDCHVVIHIVVSRLFAPQDPIHEAHEEQARLHVELSPFRSSLAALQQAQVTQWRARQGGQLTT